ncbi:uncharacterized protein [Triticum aestivum]|uniref:uncharacterized protein isoform X2 n=1 Tax=Triticum aestivum TaxID=4565 RepID=UPI001D00F79A|nr:uncharacterized protein LOC123162906 isoform X2 [Triticum aestivum]XP_044436604.1 uncharacterized protein LOC123162906 isoform X2 [Triticum aestivum]XP_044436606.1 uncharacterized protein LOC123162906 isoform X2 [Triticum aestivum]XP_044436607.1 uncharacterized protein LOC123162906 isoform X2 [Triticum aestivum]
MADAPCCLVTGKACCMCSTASCSLLGILSSLGDVKVSYCDQGNSMYLCGLFLLLIGVAVLKLLEGKEQRIREAKQPKEPENMTPAYVRPYPPWLLQGPDARFLLGAWGY